jgi:uncharacterized protein YjbI with pentapeptide repeats
MTDYALNINSILLNTPDGCREETAKWPSPPIDNPDWNTNLQKLIRENSCPGCDLHSMVFRNPVYLVDDTNLRGANLSGSFLYGTMINRAFLSDANLSGSKMINVSLAASNFDRADMSRVNMSSNCGASDLSNAYFFDAILQGADLTGANLKGSYLTRANMQNANLTGANLTRAELYDADLTNANLYNADLTDAVLTGAKTSGATWTDGRICDQGSTGPCRRCAWKCTQRCIEWEYEPGMKWPMCIKWEESCKFEDCIDP